MIKCSLCNSITGVFYYVVKKPFNRANPLSKGVICVKCSHTLSLNRNLMLIQNNGEIIR